MPLPDLWWAQQQTIHLLHIYLLNPQLNRNANTVLTKCQHIRTNNTESNIVSFISPQTRRQDYTHTRLHVQAEYENTEDCSALPLQNTDAWRKQG